MARFDLIAFDADDTLWQNEHLFLEAQATFKVLLSKFHPPEWVAARLYETEMRNMQHFGYGIKAFALSMIETALDLSEDRLAGEDVRRILETATKMLAADYSVTSSLSKMRNKGTATAALSTASTRVCIGSNENASPSRARESTQ